jgi:hypothetical protein
MLSNDRYINSNFPIESVSLSCRREKSIRQGHISTLQTWWASYFPEDWDKRGTWGKSYLVTDSKKWLILTIFEQLGLYNSLFSNPSKDIANLFVHGKDSATAPFDTAIVDMLDLVRSIDSEANREVFSKFLSEITADR